MDHLNYQGFYAYALDFLGYGLSDRYPEMSSEQGVPPGGASAVYRDIAIAADQVLARSRHKKLILIAHSWGGTAAALYAEKFPDRVEKLVLYATITPWQSSSPHEAIARTFEAMIPESRVGQMDRLAPPGPKRQLALEVLDHWAAAWRRSDSAQEWAGEGLVRFPSGPSADIEALSHGRSYFRPEELRSPVLIVRGDQDTYPSAEDAQVLRMRMTKAPSLVYRVIEGGTHVMHLETRRRKLYEAVDSFIR